MVPAHAKRAVTAAGRPQATAAEGMTIGCWVLEVDDDASRILGLLPRACEILP
jgi:hypothetical protein